MADIRNDFVGIKSPNPFPVVYPDPGFALMMEPLIPQSRHHQFIEILVVGELDVSADVPDETLVVGVGGSQTPDFIVSLINVEVGMS